MHRAVTKKPPTMLPTIFDMCGAVMYRTNSQSKMPQTNDAAQSSRPPPKTMQNPALPRAEASTCSQTGWGRMVRISCRRTRASSNEYFPDTISRESWLTATTLSSCVPLKGMNSTFAYLLKLLVVKMPLLSTKKLFLSTP